MSLTDEYLFGKVESLSMDLVPNRLVDRVLGAMFRHCDAFRSSLHGGHAAPLRLCHGEVHLSPVGLAFFPVEYCGNSFLYLLVFAILRCFEAGCWVSCAISASVASKIATFLFAVLQAVLHDTGC